MPNGMYGGVRGWGREAPAYSIGEAWLAKRKKPSRFTIRDRREEINQRRAAVLPLLFYVLRISGTIGGKIGIG
jgi:hypothetical protein